MRVAVLGLGQMGSGIARRLRQGGYELTVYNRSEGPTREFAELGVAVAPSPREAVAGADVCVTMLADGAAVEAVLLGPDGVLSASGDAAAMPDAIIEMSTIDVATSAAVARRAGELGVDYVRAPVSGNPSVLAAGNLVILASGEALAVERVHSVLEAIGPTVHYLGAGEQARVMKLSLNLMLAGTAQLMAEALSMGEASGLARWQMLEVMANSAIGSPFIRYKSEALVLDDYSSTFSSRLMEKDLRLALDCAAGEHIPMPATELVRELVADCIAAGMGEQDFMVLLPRLQAKAAQSAAGSTA